MIFKREDVAKIPDVIHTHMAAIEASLDCKNLDGYPDLLTIGKHLNALGMLAEGLRHEFAAEIVKKNLEEADREAFVSREKREVCPVCLGHGRLVNSSLDCLECHGTGAVRVSSMPYPKGFDPKGNLVVKDEDAETLSLLEWDPLPPGDCENCEGTGNIVNVGECPKCHGIGYFRGPNES